jgi:hypothetical protein
MSPSSQAEASDIADIADTINDDAAAAECSADCAADSSATTNTADALQVA